MIAALLVCHNQIGTVITTAIVGQSVSAHGWLDCIPSAVQAIQATPAPDVLYAVPRGSSTAIERLALTPSLTGIEPDDID